MKKVVLILSIFIFSGLCLFSQNITQKTFYNEANISTKEIYEVLISNNEIYNGDYRLYSEEGNLLERGYYSNNSKVGDWIKINSDGNILYYGTYKNNEFTGYQFSWDEDGIVISDYYQNSVNLEKDTAFLLESIAQIRERLSNSGFANHSESKIIYDSYMDHTDISDSLNIESIISNFDHLAEEGILHYAMFNLFEESKVNLESLINETENYQTQNSENPLIENIASVYKKMQKLYSSEALKKVIDGYIPLSDEFRVTSGLIDENTVLDQNINKGFEELNSSIAGLPIDFYLTHLEKLKEDNINFTKEKNLSDKLQIGNKLINAISSFNTDLISVGNIFNEISSLQNDLESNYKSNYPLIYNNIETEINKKQELLIKTTEIQEKVKIGDGIKKDISVYKSNFLRLDSIQSFINNEFEPLKNIYLQQYPSIYSKEIKSLDATVSNFNKLISIEDKINEGDEIITRIIFYKTSIIDFADIDKSISEKFPAIAAIYKEKYREIYKSEVVILQKVFKQYKLISGAISKIETGNQIRDKITELETNLEILGKQDIEIQENFPLIAQRYEAELPYIFKSDIKLFERKIELQKKTTSSSSRLAAGEEILNDIVDLNNRFKEIKDQEAEINLKLNQVEGNYQIDFPQIYKSEIKDAKANINSYEEEGSLNNKVTLGNIILERFNSLLDAYPALKEENIKITTELPIIIKDYRDFFPILYKLHIVDLISINRQYEGSGYMMEKVMLSSKIVKSIDDLQEKYIKFKTQIDLIDGLFSDFNLYYQNRKPVAKILKKGNNVYKELRKGYDNETNLEEKMKKGKVIELMLSKLIALANEENSDLNSKMRSVKVPEDMLSLLGIK